MRLKRASAENATGVVSSPLARMVKAANVEKVMKTGELYPDDRGDSPDNPALSQDTELFFTSFSYDLLESLTR